MDKFIGEKIDVEQAADAPRPVRFTWRGETHEITDVLSERVDTGFGALGRCSRRWSTRRHRRYFVVRDTAGDCFEMYLDYADRRRYTRFLVKRLDAGKT